MFLVMMNSKNSDFVSLIKHVKVEHNTNDYCNNNEYLIESEQKRNVSRNEIKCKSKCFDIVDRWIARVVVKVPTGNNWHNIVAREVALLKVRYPFLTEQQLRGKSLVKFGIPSLCGNVVRTGAGKVTSAIAKELSRKKAKTRRIPTAFKVLKNFLPCMNKFEAKRETNMWLQENQRTPTLYNRETTNCTEKIVQTKTMVKPEKMEQKHWGPAKLQSLVVNPMNKQLHFCSSPNTRLANNASEEISCTALTPRKEQPLIPRRKALLSEFNDTDMTILNENKMIEEGRMKIKQEIPSPDSKQCLSIIANDFKENLCYNGENGNYERTRPKKKKPTYSQSSQESIDVLARFQRGLQSQGLRIMDDSHRKSEEIRPMENTNRIFKEIDSDETEFEPDYSNYSYRNQLLSKKSAKRCGNENSFMRYTPKTSSQSVPILDNFPSYSQERRSSQGIKRQYSDSMDISHTPQKKFKNNNNHNFQSTLSNNRSYDQVHQYLDPHTTFTISFDEFAQSETQYNENSKCGSANTFFEPTPFSGKLSSFGENGNHSGLSMPRQYSPTSHFRSLSLTKISRLSAPRSVGGSLEYLWEDMNSQNFSCKNRAESQESRTTCTLTPDIAELYSGINGPCPLPPKNIPRQKSPDLLDRGNTSQFFFPKSNSTSNANHRLDRIDYNMLSNFCSEYDIGWKRLIRDTPKFINDQKILVAQSVVISMATIRVGIEKARKILDDDIGDSF